MTSRLLPRDEWHRLTGTELAEMVVHLPDTTRVLVIEESDEIVGCWAFFSVVHAEGVWIADSHRGKSSVARRLLAGMRTTVADMGAEGIATGAITDEVRTMLTRMGAVELPGTQYALRVKGNVCRSALEQHS